MRKGRFLVLDGIDGIGKTTQLRRMAKELRRRGRRVVVVKDPGGTPLGAGIRSILLGRRHRISPQAEALLYAASRAQLVREVIRPALRKGWIVLSDRYSTATLAYQGALGLKKGLAGVCRFAESGIRPDLTLVLDCPPKRDLNRKDRLEARGSAYQRRVRSEFLAQARRDARRIRIVSALGTPAEVTSRLMSCLR